MPKTPEIEYERRIREVMEYVREDFATCDILAKIMPLYGVDKRQAERYLREAKDRWYKEGEKDIEKQRALKIEGLKKLKHRLNVKYRDTPMGIRTVLEVEKTIIALQGIMPAQKVQHQGDKDNPVQHKLEIIHINCDTPVADSEDNIS